jgi:hypothetical protein
MYYFPCTSLNVQHIEIFKIKFQTSVSIILYHVSTSVQQAIILDK